MPPVAPFASTQTGNTDVIPPDAFNVAMNELNPEFKSFPVMTHDATQ